MLSAGAGRKAPMPQRPFRPQLRISDQTFVSIRHINQNSSGGKSSPNQGGSKIEVVVLFLRDHLKQARAFTQQLLRFIEAKQHVRRPSTIGYDDRPLLHRVLVAASV
jgi:hypothetical protein